MATDNPTGGKKGGSTLDRLNLLSLLAQAGLAWKQGKKMRAALLLGAATIARKSRKLSYAIQGLLTLDSLRKRMK
ncbi:hypothetical protein AUR64_16805 [Haloprofundus marisrubri]|uniref:Uncharacterized protein n=1 Tax=Haloprofundus marisrubri TaxID=1514971 RepID=A0A0W1R7R7_9EURY|nr:hypothetical protein [Haloprofundus marisrubri]KTG09437.1 hypothetical protein AUR64_16805 [Haloprofundus marisrubri]